MLVNAGIDTKTADKCWVGIGTGSIIARKKRYLNMFKPSDTNKHHCIFEITQPNIHSELYKASFVDDYGEDYTAADDMCQSMNNFKPKDKFVHFILRCLEQEEFDVVQEYLKTNPHGDVSEVYSPFTQKIVITETMEERV